MQRVTLNFKLELLHLQQNLKSMRLVTASSFFRTRREKRNELQVASNHNSQQLLLNHYCMPIVNSPVGNNVMLTLAFVNINIVPCSTD
jgi:hypothetical protein